MSGLKAREIADKLNIIQFTRLCSIVDSVKGMATKFDVIRIGSVELGTVEGEAGKQTIEVIIMFAIGELERVRIAA